MSIMSCQEVKCRMREESSRPLETTSSPNSLEEQEKEVALVLDFDNFNYHVLDKRASPVLIMSVRLDSLQSISLFFPSDNQSWEASDDPEEPCRWPWYCNRKHQGEGGKKICYTNIMARAIPTQNCLFLSVHFTGSTFYKPEFSYSHVSPA